MSYYVIGDVQSILAKGVQRKEERMSSDISNRTQGRNNMNVPNVSKPLLHLLLLQFINEHTQEKSPINVLSVERPLLKWVISRHT